ncbi:GNAT family N-acetyltransferase [Celerinatantimonas yamalensis]|uniref:GNAT family N-acetyltransferase n=1 Tax=Celerinatantimonas yamalensis TaxID=559956 RepID=A0ABW9G1C7_9GAMM
MAIQLLQISNDEFEETFGIFKQYMYPIIDAAIGWDEVYQSNGFRSHLKPEWFSWITVKGQRVGLVCHRFREASLHIHLLIIFSHAQRKGLASEVLNALEVEASNCDKLVTLSCFKNNNQAFELYNKNGYVIHAEDEMFYDLIKMNSYLTNTAQ